MLAVGPERSAQSPRVPEDPVKIDRIKRYGQQIGTALDTAMKAADLNRTQPSGENASAAALAQELFFETSVFMCRFDNCNSPKAVAALTEYASSLAGPSSPAETATKPI